MKIDVREQDQKNLYIDLINLLHDIKISSGPLAVDGTLKKHPAIRMFLREYQQQLIYGMENRLAT